MARNLQKRRAIEGARGKREREEGKREKREAITKEERDCCLHASPRGLAGDTYLYTRLELADFLPC